MKRGHTISTLNQSSASNGPGIFSKLKLVLHRFKQIPLDLYSYIASNGGMNLLRCSRTQSGLSFAKESPTKKTFSSNFETKVNSVSKLNDYIGKNKFVRISAIFAAFALVVLTSAIMVPIYNNISITEAATSATLSSTSLTLTSSSTTASVDLSVNKDNGTFASSTNPIAFSVTTNNYTGYTLSLSGASGGSDGSVLTNNINNGNSTETNPIYSTLSSISSAVSSDTFSADSTSAGNNYNGKFGILPSKYNSTANSSYLPAPTSTTAITLDKTTSPNSAANGYTIGLGARASYETTAGTYTGTYVLTLVGNAVGYALTYSDNTSDSTVANLPSFNSDPNNHTQSGSVSASSITLSSTIPTRTGYTFKSWCSVAPTSSGTVCSGDSYNAGSTFYFSQKESNTVTLYAIWGPNTYTLTLSNSNSPTSNGSTAARVTYNANTLYGGASGTSAVSKPTKARTMTFNTNGTGATAGKTSDTYTWTFNGWYTAASGGTKVISNAATPALIASVGSYTNSSRQWIYAGTTTLYAQFSSVNYTMPSLSKSSYTCTWNTKSDGTGISYTPGTAYNLALTANTTYYARCTTSIANATYMQDVTAAMVSGTAAGATKTLTDRRDNQTYTVAKIGSLLWMTRNLAIGCAGTGGTYSATIKSISLNSTYSNVSSTWSTPTALLSAASSSTQTADYSTARMQCNSTYGAWYNYAAATAGTITGDNNSTEASYSVCPKGWRLPTHAELGPMGTLDGSTTNVSIFKPVYSGHYYDGTLDYTGSSGYGTWWASTAGIATSRYFLRYHSGKLYADDTYYGRRIYGLSVRCVLK